MSETPALALVTNAGDGTVSTFAITRGAQPDLTRIAVSPVATGCSTLVIDPARSLVHVGAKAEPDGTGPGVVTCAIEPDGSLTVRSRVALDAQPHFLALTPDGRTLCAAAYHGGFGVSLPVADDGTVSAPRSRIDEPNMHSVAIAGGGRHAYFVSLGADLIAQCALEAATLTPLDPPTVAAPIGSGPRHIAISSDELDVYVVTEFSGEVLHYRRDPQAGTLTLRGSAIAHRTDRGLHHGVINGSPKAHHDIWGADLHLAHDDRALWASERTESTLATLAVDADGTPHDAHDFIDTQAQPRGFGVSPTGDLVLVAGELSGRVSLYEVGEAGALREVATAETGPGPNWVRFVAPVG